MPRESFDKHFEFLPKRELLTFEELTRLTQLFLDAGVKKVRVTGGEPLLRHELPTLIRLLKDLGPADLALTTNGALLGDLAAPLRDAGLDRVTVSVDSLDPDRFAQISDTRIPLSRVLDGIDRARSAGLPVKINTVVQRGVNDDEVAKMVEHFSGVAESIRFIEFMDVGNTNSWDLSRVVPSAELEARLERLGALEAIAPHYGDVARRYHFTGSRFEVGFISSVTQPFCGDCNRARLSAKGSLYTCLFASAGLDLREPLRAGASDDELRAILHRAWTSRSDRYSELRTLPIDITVPSDITGPSDIAVPSDEAPAGEEHAKRKVEMSHIGG
jgi:cyclic pyranopterin phosphate synthase